MYINVALKIEKHDYMKGGPYFLLLHHYIHTLHTNLFIIKYKNINIHEYICFTLFKEK